MRYSAGTSIAIAVGALAVAAPILFSVQLAWREGIATERALTLSYAKDALRRTDEMGQEIGLGMSRIAADKLSPCSPQEIDLMHKVHLGFSYIQAVGRMVGNNLVCSSFGDATPIPLGPPTLHTYGGAEERLNLRLPMAGDHPIDIFTKDGIAFLLDPQLPLDILTEGPNTSLAIFVPSSPNHELLASRNGSIRPEWFRDIPQGTSTTFVNAGFVVAIARDQRLDAASIVAAPVSYARERALNFAFMFIPVGLLCAGCLAWAATRLSRMQHSLPAMLRSAARRKEFFVEYQPIVEMTTGRCIGAEALVRWRRAGKVIPPDSFIPAAEESGAITYITNCVAELVTADLPKFVAIDPAFSVAINLSATDLRSTDTIQLIQSILSTDGISPENLKIEATEHGFLQGAKAQEVLSGIHALGVKISIDDFGTGYSSLSRLETLHLDALKIDKSFVDTINTDGVTSQVVPHIINMAHSLRLTIIAEGVATREQAAFLRQRRVHHAQGSLYGLGMSFDALFAILQLQEPAEQPEVFS